MTTPNSPPITHRADTTTQRAAAQTTTAAPLTLDNQEEDER